MLAALAAATTPRWAHKAAAWTAAVLVAGLVGLTRMYLGAHWLTDVVGGWALGSFWLFALLTAVRTRAALRAAGPRAGGRREPVDPPSVGPQSVLRHPSGPT
jgi:undecaprenyl-diphosphatase